MLQIIVYFPALRLQRTAALAGRAQRRNASTNGRLARVDALPEAETGGIVHFGAVPLQAAGFQGASAGMPQRKAFYRPSSFALGDGSNIPRRQFLFGKHYVRKYVSATISPGGVGKSSFTMAEALSMRLRFFRGTRTQAALQRPHSEKRKSACCRPAKSLLRPSAMARALFTADERAKGYRLDLDMSGLLRADPAQRWAGHKIALDSRVLTPEEVRKIEGFGPTEGKTDVGDSTEPLVE